MELLEQYLALTTDEARAEFLAGLSPDDLATLLTDAEAAWAEAEGADASDESIQRLTALADTLEALAGEGARREQASADLETARQEQIARVRGQEGGAEGEGEGEGAGAEGEGAEGAEGEGGEAAAPGEGEGAEGAGAEGEGAEQGAEAVAAGGAPVLARARPRLGDVRATARPAGPSTGGQSANGQRAAIVASAEVPNHAAGDVLVAAGSDDFSALGRAIAARVESLKGARNQQRVLVASIQGHMPEDRILDPFNALANVEMVERVTRALRSGSEAALAAAGGYCAPGTIRWDLPTVGDTDQPIRDSLPSFGAPRGQWRWIPGPVLSDVPADALSIWTNQDDIDAAGNPHVDPDDDVTKACARIECPDEDDGILDALVTCLEFGNFNARTFPELVEAYLRLVAVADARRSEQRLLTQMDALTTAVTAGTKVGATADVLSHLDRLVTNLRGVYRVEDTRVRIVLPTWFQEMARTDLMRQMPGGGTTDERYALAAERLASWFRARNAMVTWTPDSQIPALQGAGAITALPATVVSRVYIEGTFGYVDGGELNLGVIRDAALVAINSYRQFSERWNSLSKFGSERAFTLTSTVCASGTVSGTTAVACP